MLGSPWLLPAASSALRPAVEPLFSLPYLPTIFHSRFEGFYLKWWRTRRMWQRRRIPALLRPLRRRPSAPAVRFGSSGNASRRRWLGFWERSVTRRKKKGFGPSGRFDPLFKKLLKFSFAFQPLSSLISHRGTPSIISQLISPFCTKALALFDFRSKSFLL